MKATNLNIHPLTLEVAMSRSSFASPTFAAPNTLTLSDGSIVEVNARSFAGKSAGASETFGDWNRYKVSPVYNRFGSVDWLVEDAERTDELTGLPAVVGQYPTKKEALQRVSS